MRTGYSYEESVCVPLVVMDPRMPESMHNARSDEFTLNIDLAPTLLQAAKIHIPCVMQGRDFAPLYLNDDVGREAVNSSWRTEFYYEWFTGDKVFIPSSLALVRNDSKYIYWPEYDHEELFHLLDDPFEEHNLFNKTMQSSKETLDAMKTQFEELKVAAKMVSNFDL